MGAPFHVIGQNEDVREPHDDGACSVKRDQFCRDYTVFLFSFPICLAGYFGAKKRKNY